MEHIVGLSDLLPFVIVAIALAVVGIASWYFKPDETAAWLRNRADFLVRFWNFWGPRLTDRGFVGAIFANGAVLGFLALDPARAQIWQFIVWAAANLFFPLWDNHPAGERVLKPRIETDCTTVSGPGPRESIGH